MHVWYAPTTYRSDAVMLQQKCCLHPKSLESVCANTLSAKLVCSPLVKSSSFSQSMSIYKQYFGRWLAAIQAAAAYPWCTCICSDVVFSLKSSQCTDTAESISSPLSASDQSAGPWQSSSPTRSWKEVCPTYTPWLSAPEAACLMGSDCAVSCQEVAPSHTSLLHYDPAC